MFEKPSRRPARARRVEVPKDQELGVGNKPTIYQRAYFVQVLVPWIMYVVLCISALEKVSCRMSRTRTAEVSRCHQLGV
jgi:hypothetical protein